MLVGVCNARTEITYWRNGNKQSEKNDKDGKKYGPETLWNMDGTKRSVVNYKDGKRVDD